MRRIQIDLFYITFISLLSRFLCKIYSPEEIVIPDCTPDATSLSETALTTHINCASNGQTKNLGGNTLKFLQVQISAETALNDNVCVMKNSASDKKGLTIKSDKVEYVLYVEAGVHKLLLKNPSGSDSTCGASFDVTLSKKGNQHIYVDSLKCIKNSDLTTLTPSTIPTDTVHVQSTSQVCFLPNTLTAPIVFKPSLTGQSYQVTISPYPENTCPTCTDAKDLKAC